MRFPSLPLPAIRTGYQGAPSRDWTNKREQVRFLLAPNLPATVAIFVDREQARFYLIPSPSWQTSDALLNDRDYEGLKSKPEYGLNISRKNLPLLERFAFHEIVRDL